MRVFRTTYNDRNGKRRTATKWYVELRDHREQLRRIPAFADKRASAEFGRKLERVVAARIAGDEPDAALTRWLEGLPAKTRTQLARIGLLDSRRIAATKALDDHLDDYEQSLRDSGTTTEYVQKTVNRIRTLAKGIGAKFLSDLQPAAVSRYLAQRREDGLSVKSSNHYLAAAKSLCNWCIEQRRLSENPLACLPAMNANANRVHVRRALEPDGLARLLSAARGGPDRYDMSGEARYWLYRLAVESGLRSNELRNLTRACFQLDAAEPAISVEAATAKNRRAATLPLRPDTAAELADFVGCKHPAARVFNMPRPEKVIFMLRDDLAAAGVPYVDESGRVADFRTLRVTFATMLLRSGVDVRTAKDLMRHSTISMTADVYACSVRGSQAEAVNRLPSLSPSALETARATGTDDADARLALCLAQNGAAGHNPVRDDATNPPDSVHAQPLRKTGTYGDCERVAAQGLAPSDMPLKPPPRGLEPLSSG